ncbi:hypothetical protein [Jannaschia formosa]|uniref:hypothetical protein n=1 Tax=Jannaschia formosa TaxID=2259592 RepID=UPI000E1B9E1A|nr:hypothetical protein [Jannaschia formosa]TFL16444.1 hypothetical protein DR046_20195 [Jannaschia formosa]
MHLTDPDTGHTMDVPEAQPTHETVQMPIGLLAAIKEIFPQLPAGAFSAPVGAVAKLLRDVEASKRID